MNYYFVFKMLFMVYSCNITFQSMNFTPNNIISSFYSRLFQAVKLKMEKEQIQRILFVFKNRI